MAEAALTALSELTLSSVNVALLHAALLSFNALIPPPVSNIVEKAFGVGATGAEASLDDRREEEEESNFDLFGILFGGGDGERSLLLLILYIIGELWDFVK